MNFYKQYPSGMRLVAKKLDNFYTVCLGVYVDVGSVRETDSNNGYSHFIEHMLFKGTKRRSALQISEAMDDIGAVINAYTAKDCTAFYTKSAADDVEECIDVLSDMYFNATFPQDELDREKQVVLEEIKMNDDTPDDVSQDLIMDALFHGQPLGRTILGNAQNIEYSDRHSIQKYKDLHYIPSNTVISVAGNFDFDKLDKLVEKYFESSFTLAYPVQTAEPKSQYTSEFIHRFKDTQQSHLELAVGSCSLTSPKRFAVSALSSILGGGMSSRLFQSIREQNGLAYSVYTYPSQYTDCGSFEIYAGLSPDNIHKVCTLLKKELDLLLEKGITEKELARAKVQAVNSVYSATESNQTLMRLNGRAMLKCNTQFDPDETINGYKMLTAQQINDVAHQLFEQKFASSYVGSQVDNFDEISKIGN